MTELAADVTVVGHGFAGLVATNRIVNAGCASRKDLDAALSEAPDGELRVYGYGVYGPTDPLD